MAAVAESLQRIKRRSERDALASMNYVRNKTHSDFIDAKTFDEDAQLFITRDGRFSMVWRVPTKSDDAMSTLDKRGYCDCFAAALDRTDDSVSGQMIRFTSKDIKHRLRRFSKGAVKDGFGRDVVSSIIELQERGARQGFFATVSQDALSAAQAKEEKELDRLYGESAEAKDESGEADDLHDEAAESSLDRHGGSTRGGYALVHETYLVITGEERLFGHDMLPGFANRMMLALAPKKGTDKYRAEFLKAGKRFMRNVEEIEDVLGGWGIQVGRLDRLGLTDLMYRMLNPKRSKSVSAPRVLSRKELGTAPDNGGVFGRETIAEAASFSTVVPSQLGWVIDGHHHRVASATAIPETMTPDVLSGILDDNEGEGWVTISFHAVNQAMFRNVTLRAREMGMDNSGQQNEGPGILRGDRMKHDKRRRDLDLVKSLTNPSNRDRSKVVKMNVAVVVRENNEASADYRVNRIARRMWDCGMVESTRGDAFCHASLPLNNRRGGSELLAREMRGLTMYATEMMPWFNGFQGYADGRLLFNNDYGEPIPFDVFTKAVSAPHGLVVGGTGTGKSFLINNILAQLNGQYKPKIRIVDKGDSYESLCESMGGDYVVLVPEEIDGYKPLGLNPFWIPETGGDKPAMPSAKQLEQMVLVAGTMMLAGADEGSEPVTKTNRNTVMQAINDMFAERKVGQELLLSDLLTVLREKYGDDGKALATRMMDFSREGLYGEMFDRPLEIDWSNDMMVFETGRMGDSPALRVALLMLFEQLEHQMKNGPLEERGTFLMDEAWASLAGSDAGSKRIASRVGGMYREARKFGWNVLLCSQGLSDFISLVGSEGSDAQDGIRANTSHFFMLGSSRHDMTLAKEFMNLSEQQLDLWSQSRSLPPFFSEIFYIGKLRNDNYYTGKMRLYSNPVALWMATSSPNERAMRRKLTDKIEQKHGVDRQRARRQAVNNLAKRYPYGSDFPELQHAA